jgi:hypothetical protein
VDRTVVALNHQQTCAALIRRVPAVLDGETAMREQARQLMTGLTDTDRALLAAQQVVATHERPVLNRITGQTLRELLSGFDHAKRLVAASPGRISLLGQAEQLHPRQSRTDAPPSAEDLLDRHLPLLGMALRSAPYYAPATLTKAETSALLAYVNNDGI